MDKQDENKNSDEQNENKTINVPDENNTENATYEDKTINKSDEDKTINKSDEDIITSKPNEIISNSTNNPDKNKTMNKLDENRVTNRSNKNKTMNNPNKQKQDTNTSKKDEMANMKKNREFLHSNQISYAYLLGYVSITFELNIALYPAIIDLWKEDESLNLPEHHYLLNWLPYFMSILGVGLTFVTELHKYPRKPMLYISLIWSIIGWTSLLFGRYIFLAIGRLLIGFALGIHSVIMQYCIYECIFVDKNYMRSIAMLHKPYDFLLRTAIYISIGWIGDFVGWRSVITMSICYHIFALYLLSEVLESPYSFLRENREPQARTCFFDELTKVNFSDTIAQYAKMKNNVEEVRKHEEKYDVATIVKNCLRGLYQGKSSVANGNGIHVQETGNAAVDAVNSPKVNRNQKTDKSGQMTRKLVLILLHELSGFTVYYFYLTTIIKNKMFVVLCTFIFIVLREKIEHLCSMIEQSFNAKNKQSNSLHYSKLFTGLTSLALGILFFVEQYFDSFILKLLQILLLEFYFVSYIKGCAHVNNSFLSETPYYVNIKLIAPALALKYSIAFFMMIFISSTCTAFECFSLFFGVFSLSIFATNYHLT